MFKLLFTLVAITTIISMAFIGKLGMQHGDNASLQPAPIMVSSTGAISFPGRIPAPEVVYQLRQAAQANDAATLNALLVEHRLFLASTPK
ncbi:MAG: hypothetical protein QM496_21295 [Verrucomicrobiota bacterium]